MILEHRGIFYYRDIQGRYYRSDGGGCFYMPQIERSDYLWHILEGDEKVIKEKRRMRIYCDQAIPKTAPQPIKRFLP